MIRIQSDHVNPNKMVSVNLCIMLDFVIES